MTPATWFHDCGVGVFPIVTPGKTPACPSWDDYTCTRTEAARFRNYGVRLGRCRTGWLAVADSDTPETETWATAHLPDTPFKVRTARGVHRYYRVNGFLPKFIHRDGHTIEFRNQGQYVVGPGSVHSTGMLYTVDKWSWWWEAIPFFPTDFVFDDRPFSARGSGDGQPLVLPESVRAGERHETLHRIMRSLVAHGVPLDGAMATCRSENRVRCCPPLTDTELDDAFLRRAYQQKDRADFVRTPKTGWDLCGSLIDIGLSVESALVAVRSVTPDFDPNAPEPTLEPDTPTVEWDLDSPGGLL